MQTWIELLAQISELEREDGGTPPQPATQSDIATLLESAKKDGLHINQTYVDLLKIRNGITFNGLNLYGANVPTDGYGLDLLIANRYMREEETWTAIGTSDIDLYIIAESGTRFQRCDRGSGDIIDDFATCDELLVSILEQQIEMLQDTIETD